MYIKPVTFDLADMHVDHYIIDNLHCLGHLSDYQLVWINRVTSINIHQTLLANARYFINSQLTKHNISGYSTALVYIVHN